MKTQDHSSGDYCAMLFNLEWPLQEAFQVDFGHEDFSRQATGFFHLRPPSWDLNEVLRFSTEIDVATCPLRLAYMKALFLTALAAGNRCAELAHFSRRALVDADSSLTLDVMPRFLYKILTAGRSPPPVTILLFRDNPALCPVVALRIYISRTTALPHRDFVFSLPSCRSPHLLGGTGTVHSHRSGLGHPCTGRAEVRF